MNTSIRIFRTDDRINYIWLLYIRDFHYLSVIRKSYLFLKNKNISFSIFFEVSESTRLNLNYYDQCSGHITDLSFNFLTFFWNLWQMFFSKINIILKYIENTKRIIMKSVDDHQFSIMMIKWKNLIFDKKYSK